MTPGRLVLRRQFMRDGLLSRVWAGRVAADDDLGLWLWIAAGSAYRDIAAADGRSFRAVPFGEWGRTAKVMRELTWRGDMLVLHPPGRAHSIWLFFEPDGCFRHWYINLEEPTRRWDDGAVAGVDTVDQDLDVVVAPDRSWRWKDEEEFGEHLAHPDVYWVADEAAVRAEGERLIGLVETGAFPFDGTGTTFRPDPSWSVPMTMAPGWDRPYAARPGMSGKAPPSFVDHDPKVVIDAPKPANIAPPLRHTGRPDLAECGTGIRRAPGAL